jgi:hypothetical protein
MTADAGIPIARPTVSVPVKLDPHGCLDEDISCRKCGYNLRGLSPDGRCPECGTAVGRSLRGDYLHFADPQWVQTLASGMNWIVAGIVVGIMVGVITGGLIGSTGLDRIWLSIIQIAVSLIGLVGYWKVTAPDPAGLENPGKLSMRKLVRICQIAALGILLLSLFLPKGPSKLSLIFLLASTPLSMIGTVAIFTYAGQLALRIPDETKARHCRIVMWGILILSGCNTVLLISLLLLSTASSLTAGGCVVGVGSVFFGIWALLLLLRFRTALRDAADLAAATWAAGLPPR